MAIDPSGLVFVFTAGVFTLFTPCGFPMLPGYISYYLGTRASLGKVVPSGVLCALGLVAVFSAIGVIASTLGSFIAGYIPFLELVAGLIVVLMGAAMLVEVRLPAFWTRVKAPKRSGLIGIFLYGAAYGMATLGCSAPIFFSILLYALAAGGPLHGAVTFLVYALGTGLPLIITTVLVAKARAFMLEKLMKMTPWLQKTAGVVLVVIGVYLLYFYHTSLYTV